MLGLRLFLILFSLGNFSWIYVQWKQYTLNYVDAKKDGPLLGSPHIKRIPLAARDSPSHTAHLHPNIDPIAFDSYSLQIWQPSLIGVALLCFYSPFHIFVLEIFSFSNAASYWQSLFSLVFLSILACLLVHLFYSNVKDKDILFQQVLREYNLKFVYPTITTKVHQEYHIKALEDKIEEMSQCEYTASESNMNSSNDSLTDAKTLFSDSFSHIQSRRKAEQEVAKSTASRTRKRKS